MFPKTLRLEILAALALKAVLLTLLYLAVLAPATPPQPGAAAMRNRLLDTASR